MTTDIKFSYIKKQNTHFQFHFMNPKFPNTLTLNHMASCSNIDTLPEDCVSKILSYTSPKDACTFSMVSSTLQSPANSDTLWRTFLPSDYDHILSRTLNPLTLQPSSYKHLFYSLSQQPLLLDKGNISFKLDKCSGKKSYILSARELSITWSNDPMYWSWRPTTESR
ncbi:hypothetical protein KIW84_064099 [Lathyrus oleraceus]|nr:hypothetical protein KIW84_064099 [Pisum sativum]